MNRVVSDHPDQKKQSFSMPTSKTDIESGSEISETFALSECEPQDCTKDTSTKSASVFGNDITNSNAKKVSGKGESSGFCMNKVPIQQMNCTADAFKTTTNV